MKQKFLFLLLAAVAMLLPTTMRAQCDGGTECTIIVSVMDSYGDGWEGGPLEIIQNGEVVEEIYHDDSGKNWVDHEVTICTLYDVEVVWNGTDNYHENDFRVYNGDESLVIEDHGYNYSDGETVTTFTPVCPSLIKPTDLVASDITADGMTLSWTDDVNTGVTYKLSYTDAGGNVIVISDIAEKTYTLTGLTAWTKYTFSVVAVDGENNESGALTGTFSTLCASTTCTWEVTSMSGSAFTYYGATVAFQMSGETFASVSYDDDDWTVQVCPTGAVTITATPAEYTWSDASSYATVNGPAGVLADNVNLSTLMNNPIVVNDPCPSCLPVSDLAVTETTTSGATFTWTAGGTETQWLVWVDDQDAELIDANTYTVDGLEANSGYTFYVRAYCSAEDTAAVKSIDFMTACAGSTCEITVTANNPSYDYGSNYYPTASVYSNGALVATVQGDTKLIEVCGSDSVKIVYTRPSYNYGSPTVTVLDGGGVEVYSNNSSSKATGDVLVTFEPCPTCIPPIVSVDSVAQEEAYISWIARSGATDFAIYLDGEFIDNVYGDTSYIYSGLTNNTKYSLGVQAICEIDVDSSAIATANIRTLCGEMPIPYMVDFEDVEYNGASYPCIDTILRSNTDPSVNTAYTTYGKAGNHTDGGQYAMYFANSSTPQMVVTREVPLPGDMINVTFWAISNGATLEAGVMTDKSDTSTFIPVLTIDDNGNNWAEYEFNTADLDASQTYYVAWRHMSGGVSKIDDIVINERSSCERPSAAWVQGNAGVYDATVAWNSVDGALGYEVLYNTVNDITNPDALPSVSGISDTVVNITGLNQNTTYYAWVRTECAGDTKSDVRYIGYFTTQISCADVKNISAKNITYVAAELQWEYQASVGFETSGVIVTLIDNTEADTTVYDVTGNSHLFTGLQAGHSYTAYFRNYCATVGDQVDTANAVSFTFMTSSCSEISGNTTNQMIPSYTYYGNSYSQAIYTAEMMPPISSFSGISLNVTSANTGGNQSRTMDVYVGSTDKTSFSDNNDWVDVSTLTQVATGITFNSGVTGWQEIAFDETYNYEGGNLVVVFNDKTNNYGGAATYAHVSGSNQGLRAYRDNTNYDPSNPGGGTLVNSVPAIRFTTECEVPTCYAPMLSIDETDSTFVTLSWYQIGTESNFALKYKANGDADYNMEGSVADLSYTFMNLNPNTLYTFAVGSICGDDTLWSTIQVRTECGPMHIPYSDDFEADVTNEAPACWTVGIPYAYSSTQIFPRVENYGNNSTKNIRFYGNGPELIATDIIPLHADSINVQFDARVGSSYYSSSIVAGMVTDPTDFETFVPIDTITVSSYTHVEFNTAGLLDASKQYRLAFYFTSSSNYGSGDVDNVLIRKDDGCHRPSAVTATADSTDVHAINLSWANDGNGTTAVIEYGYSNSSETVEVTMTGDTTEYTLNNLDAATVYTIRVGIVCTDDTLWANDVNVGTGCAPVELPYLEIFDSPIGQLPMCWLYTGTNGKGATTTSSYIHWNRYTTHSETSGDGELMAGSNSAGAAAILPDFETPINKLEITFIAKVGNVSEGDGMMMGAYDESLDTVFWVDTLTNPDQSREGFVEFTYNYLTYEGAGTRIAIGHSHNNPSDWGFALDSIRVVALNDCPPVTDIVVSDVAVSNKTELHNRPNDIKLTWNSEADEGTTWDIYFDTITSTINPNETDVEEMENFYNVDEKEFKVPAGILAEGARYNFYIRTNCGMGLTSNWYAVQNGVSTNEIWMNQNSTGIVYDTVVGCNMIVYDNGGPIAGYMHNTNSGLVIKSSQVGKELQVRRGWFNSGSDANTLNIYDGIGTSGTLLYTRSTQQVDETVDSIICTSTEGALTITYTSGYYANLGYELDIQCVDGASCYRPTELAVISTDYNQATVSWSGNAAEYDVYYRANGESTWMSQHVEGDTIATITGLQPVTDYDFYVQGICSSEDSSYLSHSESFRTRCAPIEVTEAEPYFYGFNEVNVPECFTLTSADPANTANMTTVAAPVEEGTRSFRFSATGSAEDYNLYLISPEFAAEENMQVDFYVKAVNDNIPMSFGTSSTTRDISAFTFESAATISATGANTTEWTKITRTVPANTKFIAINYAPAAATNGYLFVDSLYVSISAEVEPCFAPTITGTAAAMQQITVNYSGTGNIEYGITTGTEWDESITGIPVSTNPLVLPGLAIGTTYTIGLRTNCGENGYSNWVTTTVTTLEAPCDQPTDVVASNITFTTADLSWNGGTANSWQIAYNDGTTTLYDTADVPTATLTDLEPATTYTVQVRALCSNDRTSDWSVGITFNTLACATPTDLATTNVGISSATINWTGTGTKWEVEVNGEVKATATTKPYTLTGLNESTDYTVRVRTVCEDKYYSDWSAPATFTTEACAIPTNVTVESVDSTSATINWTSAASEWEIKYNNEVVKVTTKPYKLTGLTPNTAYVVQVRAICDATHTSDWSTAASFTTDKTGIDDVNGNVNVNLYPNPASSIVTIALDGVEGTATVSIVDLNGRNCGVWNATDSKLTIDLSQFARGTYFVRVASEQGVAVRKLMVR